MKNKDELKSIAELKQMAEDYGVQDNALFKTTMDRYMTQIKVLERLKETIDDAADVLVTKEYVKGRGNYYTHPAITEYNRTSDSANKTVATILKIIKNFGDGETGNDDPLAELINGDGVDD